MRQLIDKINSYLLPCLSLLDRLKEVTENLGNRMDLRLSKCKEKHDDAYSLHISHKMKDALGCFHLVKYRYLKNGYDYLSQFS